MFERWLMLAAALSLTSAALAESPVQEERRVAGFSEVYLKASGELDITQGDSEKLLIEAPRSYLDRVTTEVRHGRLVLGYKSKPFESGSMLSFRGDVPVKFHLTVKQLDRIALSGSGDITAHALVTDTLAIDSSGAGNVLIDALTAKELTVKLNGSSDIKLAGQVASQAVEIAGSGSYAARDLRSGSASVSVIGSADAVVWAVDSLAVSIAGSGDVRYHGQPKITQSVRGSGEVRSLAAR